MYFKSVNIDFSTNRRVRIHPPKYRHTSYYMMKTDIDNQKPLRLKILMISLTFICWRYIASTPMYCRPMDITWYNTLIPMMDMGTHMHTELICNEFIFRLSRMMFGCLEIIIYNKIPP